MSTVKGEPLLDAGPLTHAFQAMSSQVELKLVCDSSAMNWAARLAEDWFAKSESIFSRFRHESELESINRAGGSPVLISSMMMEVLQLADAYRRKTAGLCTPFVGQSLLDAGYTESFERLQADLIGALGNSSAAFKEEAPLLPVNRGAQSCMTLDAAMVSVQVDSSVRLDLGGIVKSWTASRLARWLQSGGGIRTGLINAGGDLLAWQGANESPLWRIGISMPNDSSQEIASRSISNGAVATSGSWRRRWQTNEGARHHLIDPRTGCPASSDVIQCSVAGPDVTECEVWAKSVCIAGEEFGIRLMNERVPQYEAVVVDRSGRIKVYGNGWEL
ncbi:FAD:protein FMN transferase [Paenibacillus kobensis]|uniref:FAD:protein FMN transferase n=1 Tax=Paenibacillus kobensis TaxID=59841 RepID=UPI0013E3FD2F|nr:FAD:protein FMN transferase [Paenibacillus kobensis]